MEKKREQTEWDVDWFAIEQEYITARKKISMRRLAIKFFPGDATKQETKLQSFAKAMEWQAAHSPKGKWTDLRKRYWDGIANQVLQEKSEDELTQIRKMRQQERHELEKSLLVTESMIARLVVELNQDETSGSFLFPSMNREELLDGLNVWSQVRERVQKMLYKSFDIAERQDIRETRTDVPAELAEASVFEKMFGENPFDTAAGKNLPETQRIPA